MKNHGSDKTRYDIWCSPGDHSRSPAIGPNFKFEDVNIASDLHLTGSRRPDHVGQGDNLHVEAQVGDYNPTQCLFLLDPVSTEVR